VSRGTDPIPQLKAQLGAELARSLAGWRASDVSYWMGAHPSRISELRCGKLDRFSLETLIRYCYRLRVRVEFSITRIRFDDPR
jgi:hypothetical protein